MLPRFHRDWYDQLIIVDGGSTDGTAEYLESEGYFVIPQKKKGLRHAYVEAMPFVEGDTIITFSPDGNSIPELIPPLIRKMREGYDMVVVSRYCDGAKSHDDSILTALANVAVTRLVNMFYRARYSDSMVIFRAYKKDLVYRLDLNDDTTYSLEEKLIGKPVGWELILSIRCAKRKLKTAEIPGDEPRRIDRMKKVHYRWGLAMVVQVLKELFVWR